MHWLNRVSKTITSKAGNSNSKRILVRWDGRSKRAKGRLTSRQRRVDQALQRLGALGEGRPSAFLRFLTPKELVRDVQRRQHGQPERVHGRSGFGRCTHFLIH